MIRLANLFQAGKFDGPEGEIMMQEHYEALGHFEAQDMKEAVDSLRDEHEDGFFPRIAKIRGYAYMARRNRKELFKALPSPAAGDEEKRMIKEGFAMFYKAMREIENKTRMA